MNYEEIKRRVSAWGIQSEFSTSERATIEEIYFAVFGRTIPNCNCPNRYRDAVIELRIFIKNHSTMEKSKYILKAGVVIQPSGTSDVYTNDNLTDAVAEQFLKERPGARGLFEVIPNSTDADKGPENEKEAAKTAELDAALAEVESLKAENESLKDELAKMTEYRNRAVADLDKVIKAAENGGFKIDLSGEVAKVTTEKPAEQEPAAEGEKEPEQESEKAAAEKPGLNPEILAAIKARLEAGDTKSAIVKDYVGMEVDGKPLTEYGVKKYIAAATTPDE